jgi:hypothetical protein
MSIKPFIAAGPVPGIAFRIRSGGCRAGPACVHGPGLGSWERSMLKDIAAIANGMAEGAGSSFMAFRIMPRTTRLWANPVSGIMRRSRLGACKPLSHLWISPMMRLLGTTTSPLALSHTMQSEVSLRLQTHGRRTRLRRPRLEPPWISERHRST